ncbi:MAG: DEAD/DEAH box helicase family protein, partial [Pirellulaceae bacterium]|nr:DEAD/DEAH box helicase family protein [Pirellulaceae bacterium]
MPEPLKALSIRQPWAEQVLRGEKPIEYRSKPTKVRGRIYIYASLGRYDASEERQMEDEVGFPIDDLPRGLVVGTVEIVDCTGSDGEYEWQLGNPERLPEPLPPQEQPQPVWFHPFGRPQDGSPPIDDEVVAANDQDDSHIGPTTARFSPVIAACRKPFTAYHSKYLAFELTKKVGADQADKLALSLSNATVDLNPHQIDAALFAFRSPLSRGAILADEVGLGKTIEAGIIISQLWAEKKRRILVLVPASLRKQWGTELSEKFFLPSLIMESKSFRELSRKTATPFQPSNQIVICSHQFARTKAAEITGVPWDLVVIDEAHRLRNVYKKDNKIARAIRDAIQGRPKVLLTATPLQNSLMELYGLVTFVDEHVFG